MRIVALVDEPVVAAGLHTVLPQDEFQLTCIADLAGLWKSCEQRPPDILLLSVTPDFNIQTISTCSLVAPSCKVVLWVRVISREMGMEAVRLGVSGIVGRTRPNESLLECFRKVAANELWLEKDLARDLILGRTTQLTRREQELVDALKHGLRNKEIAALLGIAESSVKVYLSRLVHKLGVKDRFEVALYGLKQSGLLPANEGVELAPKPAFPASEPFGREERENSLDLG